VRRRFSPRFSTAACCSECGCTATLACFDEVVTEQLRRDGVATDGIGCHWIVEPRFGRPGLCSVCHRKQTELPAPASPVDPQPSHPFQSREVIAAMK